MNNNNKTTMSNAEPTQESWKAGDTWQTSDGRTMVVIQTERGLMQMEMIHEIPTSEIDPHPANRDEFDEQKASDMEDSLRANGQLMPAIVRKKPDGRLELIAGERRWRGCVAVGIPTLRVVVRDYSDEQALEILIWENLERENLSELQEARLYQVLMDMKDVDGRNVYTLEKIAEKRFGDVRKLSRVAQILKLNALPEMMKKALKAGVIKTRHAFLVARIADPQMREQAAKEVLNDPYGSGPMTVEKALRHIADNFQVSVKSAKFDREDVTLLSPDLKLKLGFTGAAGEKNDSSCERCQWLAKNNPAFEGELAVPSKDGKGKTGIDPQTCTFVACYHAKLETLWLDVAQPFAHKHGLPETAVLPLKKGGVRYVDYSQGRLFLTSLINATRVLVDGALQPFQIGLKPEEMPAKVPTWREVIKGAEVPMEVIAGPKNEPILIADKALAVMAGKQSMPGLFAGVKSAVAKKDMSKEELAAEDAAEKERAEMLKRELAISTGTRTAAVRELMNKIRETGAGVGFLRALCRSALDVCNSFEDALEWWFGKKMPEWNDCDHDELAKRWMEGLGANDLWALLALLMVADDLEYSWSSPSGCRDFDALCEEYGVDRKAVKTRVMKDYDAAAKAAASEAAAKTKPKLKSKGADKDEDRQTALINEELVRQEIIAEGDEQRKKAPSRPMEDGEAPFSRAGGSPLVECKIEGAEDAAIVYERLKNMEVLVTAKNQHGVFEKPSRLTCQLTKKVSFELLLAVDAQGDWTEAISYEAGTRSGGGLPKDGHSFRIRECAVAEAVRRLISIFKAPAEAAVEKDVAKLRAFLQELKKLAERDEKSAREAWNAVHNPQDGEELPEFSDEEMAAFKEWREMNPGAGAAQMAEALLMTLDEAYAIIDRLVDEKHDQKAAEKAKAAAAEIIAEAKSFEDQAKQVAAGVKPSVFIGLKPNPKKEPEKYKAWSAQRMKLERAAKRLMKAA